MSEALTKFDRLIPKEGIEIESLTTPGKKVRYLDVNDIPTEFRRYNKEFFRKDEDYREIRKNLGTNIGQYVPIYGRQYGVYSYRNKDYVGSLLYKEILNSPYGYSRDDFLLTKRIMPPFRQTKLSRYVSGDLTHFLLKSKIAKNLYVYLILKEDAPEGDDIWKIVDWKKMPCAGAVFPTDGTDTQKYMRLKCKMKTACVLELNGEIYNKMDLRHYFLAPGNRTEELAERWIREMDKGAEIVRRTACGSSTD